MHDFTIFITSFNYGHYIGNAIDSVITQTCPEWNLYILDNGSTDNTFEVIEPYLADPRIRLIKRPTNIGHTMNIALGYIELEGKFISTLQADDWLEPTFVEIALKAFTEHSDIPLVAFGWKAYIETTNTSIYPSTIPYPRSFSGITALSPHLTVGNFIPQHMIAFRKPEIASIFQEMIKTPLRQLGEQFIIKRLEDRNGPSYFSAQSGGYWRRHDTQLTNINSQNSITSIENIVEPLIYNQTRDCYSEPTRFLSLTYFLFSSAKIPYRAASEWLINENGRHLAEKYEIEIGGNERLYHCLSCALMMAHKALTSSELIDRDELLLWINHLIKAYGIEPKDILSIANQAYGGYLFSNDIELLVAEQIGKSAIQFKNFEKASLPSSSYTGWRRQRELLPQDGKIIAQGQVPGIHLLLRLQPGGESLLADTLDSLGQSYYDNWHLDIITTLPAPDGLSELPCIDWHSLEKPGGAKEAIDFLVNARRFDWLLEIPAGARLDPLCLWRFATQAMTQPDAYAFFVDDDCCDNTGKHHSPRFKPGCNPGALQSADLAGPVCMRHDAWQAIGGASQRDGSPWFSQLLLLADQFGWPAIKHVPDILISYSEAFPSDMESCFFALVSSFRDKDCDGEIIPTGGQSWGIRYPLGSTPKVTVAILSCGQLDLLSRCVASILDKTSYPEFEIVIALGATDNDPELNTWLANLQQRSSPRINVIRSAGNYAANCNAAINSSTNEFVALIREEAVVIQHKWLEELTRSCLQPDIVGASPRLISPGDALIQDVGRVLGLKGIVGSPYAGQAKLGEPGYLNYLQVTRDVSVLPAGCMMLRKSAYLSVAGMDERELGDHLAEVDLCQKLRHNHWRLIFQPLATIVYGGTAELTIAADNERQARKALAKSHATRAFLERWPANSTVDPYWNPNLSLAIPIPSLETDFRPQWQYLPTRAPRILASPLPNGQGVFRITSPLRALRKAGQAAECIWLQQGQHEPMASEVIRMAPDSLIVQHYLSDSKLGLLESLHTIPNRPFVVYTIDDLLTNMAVSNPLRKYVPADSRARLKYALERSDRLVASTDFLAEAYRHFISDIKVVPNRLEQEIWLPLQSRKRTGKNPRIGWAGGTTHQGDLALLKSVIEKTRHEADWIFFGMCPDEIRPLLSEYHALGDFSAYPARLAALDLDIAVAPLEQIPFNQGKSNLRLLEYGILGIPVVCTDIDPYRDSPACCVANSTEAWVAALRERIHDADAREQEGLTMRQWVQQYYLLERHLDEWLSAHLPE